MEGILNFLKIYLPLNRILFIRAIFGHHFSFDCRMLYLNIHKLYCIFVSFIFPLIIYSFSDVLESTRYAIFMEFFVCIWITLIVEDNCFQEYLTSIKRTDQLITHGRFNLASYRLYMVYFFITLLRMIIHFMSVKFFSISLYKFLTYAFVYMTLDLSNIIRVLIFEALYQRMIYLRNHFESIFDRPTNDCRNIISEVRRGLLIYGQLLDSVKLVNKIQVTLFITLALRFVGFALKLNMMLFKVNSIWDHTRMFMYTFESAFILALDLTPAVFSELTHNEVEKIETMMSHKHSMCTHRSLRAALSKGILYFKLRPFEFKIWRVIPVDSTLIFSFLSVFLTVSLLIFQFHHMM